MTRSIYKGVNRQRLLTLFEKLISFDSPSYGERKICDFLADRLTGLGIDVREDDAGKKMGGNCGNLFCRIPGELDLPPLLFSAHMDTVEPSRGKQMVTDPSGRITSKGNTVLGADDCAGLAAILEGLTVLKETGLSHRPLEILFSAAEEPYCAGIRQFAFSTLQAKEAYVFDLTGPVGIAAYQAPMILSFRAVFSGRSAHAGFAPEEGIHAIKAASLAISRISCGRAGNTTVNIGTISGGKGDNIVPDSCTVTGEIRSLSDEEGHACFEEVTAVMEEAAKAVGGKVTVQHTVHFYAYCTERSHPVTARFVTACENMGIPAGLCETFGGSDNNHLARYGIKGLVVATAMNNCHSCTEYTTETELERAAQLALLLMLSKE